MWWNSVIIIGCTCNLTFSSHDLYLNKLVLHFCNNIVLWSQSLNTETLTYPTLSVNNNNFFLSHAEWNSSIMQLLLISLSIVYIVVYITIKIKFT